MKTMKKISLQTAEELRHEDLETKNKGGVIRKINTKC